MKLKEFQSHLKANNIDLAFLVHPDVNITYFTQLNPSFALFLVTSSSASLYLTKLDELPSLKNISSAVLQKGWDKKLTNPKIKKVGVNKSALSLGYAEKLKKMYPQAELIDVLPALNQLRAQKTPQEINKITKACAITSYAFNELIDKFSTHKFKTEKDIAFFLDKFICEHGADPAFPSIIAGGKNSATPHHVTSPAKLRKGFLQLDFGARYLNYCSDMSRILYLGKPSVSEKKHFNLLSDVQAASIKEIAPHRPFSALETFSRKKLGKYSSRFIHSLGHGVGVEIHEHPSFSPEAKNNVKPNHIFTIEPGIYFRGKYGLRIEDTLLFDGKAKILTTAPKELILLK